MYNDAFSVLLTRFVRNLTRFVHFQGFPGGPLVKNPANAEDTGQSLVQEDTPCQGAIQPKHRSY